MMLPLAAKGIPEAVQVGAGFGSPTSVAVDSAGNLYVADAANNDVVQLPYIGGSYGSAVILISGLNHPMGVAVDPARNLYVANTGNNTVIKSLLSASGYTSRQYIGNQWLSPTSLTVDKNSNLYIADTGNGRVVEELWFAAANRYNSQVVLGSDFISPAEVAVDTGGDVFVADKGTNQVIEVVTNSIAFGNVTLGGTGPAQTYNFSISAGTTIGSVGVYTQGITHQDFFDAGGSSCVAQTYASATLCGVNAAFSPTHAGRRAGAIVLYDPLGKTLAIAFLSGNGMAPQAGFIPAAETILGADLSGPSGVAVDGGGNVYISDSGNNRIVKLPWTGAGYGEQVTVPVTGLINPMGLAVDGAGSLYIVSNGNDKVIKLPWTGNGFGPQAKVGGGLYGPSYVTADMNGNIYIADTLNNGLFKLPWTSTGFGPEQSLGDYLKFPVGVAVNAAGDVYFTMPYQNSIAEVRFVSNQYSVQIGVAVSGGSFPSTIAVDANSNLYVLDSVTNRVVMLPWTGTAYGKQITVASGFNAPSGMAIDASGNLYIADTGNNQVVRIDLSTPAPMSFAATYIGSISSDSARVASVENIGNQPLLLSSVGYPSDFPESQGVSNACAAGTPVSPGAACSLPIVFMPLIAGSPLNEAVNIVSNTLEAGNAAQAIPLSGTSLTKVAQVITMPAISDTTYGAGPISLKATSSSGLPVKCKVVSGSAILNNAGNSLTITGAGTVIVQATQAGNGQFAPAPQVTLTFLVAPATLLVTPLNITAVYGSIPASFGYSITGFVLGQTAAQTVSGNAAVTVDNTGVLAAGSHTLTASKGTLYAANYNFVFATSTLTVNRAVLQVKAVSTASIYGSAIPKLAWLTTGFVKGDTVSVVTGAPAMSTGAATGSPVGSYVIQPSLGTLAAANYTFTFITGTLSVTPALLTVTANNATAVYGQSFPSFTCSFSGFVVNDTKSVISGYPVIATTASIGARTGTYGITPTIGTLSAANYTFKFTSGVLTIQKAVLTVQVTSLAMNYGASMPNFTYTTTGFVNGENGRVISGQPTITTQASSASSVGVYPIIGNIGSLVATNYSFAFVNGELTVNKALLKVTANPVSMTYGAAPPAFSYQVSGFVNGQNLRAISGTPIFKSALSKGSPVGTYAISIEQGTLSSPNYSFAMTNGVATVQKAVLTVTSVAAAMTYGSGLPTFSPIFKGLVNGDSIQVVSGKPSFATVASAGSPVGVYPVTVSLGNLSAVNYSFSFVNGVITVNPAVLTVAANALSMTYGGSVPALSYAISGFAGSDTVLNSTKGLPVMSTPATSTSTVGQYSVNAALGTLAAANYTFQFKAGSIVVSKAQLKISANNLSMKAGSAVPALTYAVTGYVNGDTAATATSGLPALTTTARSTSPAGSYPIVVAPVTMKSTNYGLTLVNGTLTITK